MAKLTYLRSNVLKCASMPVGSQKLSDVPVCLCVFQELVIELLTDAMLRYPDSPGFLIDGFPRKLSQGVQFEQEASMV